MRSSGVTTDRHLLARNAAAPLLVQVRAACVSRFAHFKRANLVDDDDCGRAGAGRARAVRRSDRSAIRETLAEGLSHLRALPGSLRVQLLPSAAADVTAADIRQYHVHVVG